MSAEQRAALIFNVRQQVQEKNQGAAPDEAMMSQVALSQTCDIVQLLPPTAGTGWNGVSMYVDDKGVAKRLQSNRRASGVCTQCGLSVEVLGDAFIARAWDDQEGYERQDFHAADLASDAKWVLEARKLNDGRGSLSDAAQRLSLLNKPQPQWAEPELELEERLQRAAAARADGTEWFKGGDHDGAAGAYEAALALLRPAPPKLDEAGAKRVDELRLPCLLNLAACQLRQARHFDAISTCDEAIGIDEASAKAWFRRGQACSALGQYAAAMKNLLQACKLAPTSKEIREEYERCRQAASSKVAVL